MQKTAFHEFQLFCRKKVILELKCTKSHSLELLRTPNSVFSAPKQIKRSEATDAQKLLCQSEKC